MKCRKATNKDKERIGRLLSECFNIDSSEIGEKVFEKESKKDNFIVVENEEGKIKGLISWRISGLPKHQLVRVERICVLADKKRDEVANKLLETAIQNADRFFKKSKLKLRKMYAMVHSSNKKLRNFYKDFGFVEEAKIKDHYYKDVDEYILSIFFE